MADICERDLLIITAYLKKEKSPKCYFCAK